MFVTDVSITYFYFYHNNNIQPWKHNILSLFLTDNNVLIIVIDNNKIIFFNIKYKCLKKKPL